MADTHLIHLVGEDDSIPDSVDSMLRAAGHRVKRWADGEAFLIGADRSLPACVLLDVRQPLDGLEIQARMPGAGIDLPVILLTEPADMSIAVQAIIAGAADVLEKPVDPAKLLGVIAAAFRHAAARASRTEQAQAARVQLAKLTSREQDVLDRLACGYPNQTIANDLGVSSRTVQVYRSNAMVKLQVTNFADALRVAFAAGLGPDSSCGMAYSKGREPSAA